jgi:deoxyribodipyrimidine photo-lyase
MSRDQRADDNWALLHAQGIALQLQVPVVVAFSLAPKFLEATHRQFGFMLRGLRETADVLETKLKMPFLLLRGLPEETIPSLAESLNSPLLVCDFSPIRIGILWREKVVDKLKNTSIAIQEVDAHNVIPAWKVSDKLEYSAATIRRKVYKQINDFLTDFPLIQPHPFPFSSVQEEVKEAKAKGKGKTLENHEEEEKAKTPDLGLPFVSPKDWNPSEVLSSLECDSTVGEVKWLSPGPVAARKGLTKFLDSILPSYSTERNNPVKVGGRKHKVSLLVLYILSLDHPLQNRHPNHFFFFFLTLEQTLQSLSLLSFRSTLSSKSCF